MMRIDPILSFDPLQPMGVSIDLDHQNHERGAEAVHVV